MRSRSGWIVLAVLAFAAVLAWRLPVSWVLPLLPPDVSCGQASGSVWQGRCGQLTLGRGTTAVAIGAADWRLAPAALLRARAEASVQFEGPQVVGHAQVSAAAGGSLQLSDVDATLPLDRRLFGMLPPNWTGRVTLRLPLVRYAGRRLEAFNGDIEARDIVAQGPRPDDFGSYALHVPEAPAGQPHRGELRDLGGPLELQGTLVMQPDLHWQLDALVKARPRASEGLTRIIEYLGPPDANGRRSFSAAGEITPR